MSGEDIPVLKPEAIRELPERQALVVAENGKPVIAKLTRCIDGKKGRLLLAEQAAARQRLVATQAAGADAERRQQAALAAARQLGLANERDSL